jgi:DNA-binding Lrp family transcriptional regulator
MRAEQSKELIYHLQCGIPLSKRPFADLAKRLSLTEEAVIEFLIDQRFGGNIRRFGGVFDARRLGYRSVLCAVRTQDEQHLQQIVSVLNSLPSVTHCYERGWPDELPLDMVARPVGKDVPDLWFTVGALQQDFAGIMKRIGDAAVPSEMLVLPAEKRFKVEVIFDTREREESSNHNESREVPANSSDNLPDPCLSDDERCIVQLLQGDVDVASRFFAKPATEAGMTEDTLLTILRSLSERKIMRRVAAIVMHRRIGFSANAMCAWSLDSEKAGFAGEELASLPAVTHCYQRLPHPSFDYTLYAMIHADNWRKVHNMYGQLSHRIGSPPGLMLASLREFKKTSMQLFDSGKVSV